MRSPRNGESEVATVIKNPMKSLLLLRSLRHPAHSLLGHYEAAKPPMTQPIAQTMQ